MSDEIKTQSGAVMGSWDGKNVSDLQEELTRIRQELKDAGGVDKIVAADMPHRDQLPEDLQKFNAYPIWGYDTNDDCLCGARANRVVSAEDVRQFSMVDHH
ncbi:MAG: hypothetical protein KTR32_34715 [Granulosicoccus sp.]|nr:hypothetical protein [Granulosicoccus sp.]